MSIAFLVPDLPRADDLLPWLREIDRNRYYANFGPLHQRFRDRLCKAFFPGLSAEQLVLTNSGTAALELALRSLLLPPGARVLVPSYTFPATAHAVRNVGLEPVLADVEADSFQMSPACARRQLERQAIAAVIPVAANGIPVDNDAWAQFAEQTRLPVIVDAAAAIEHQVIHPRLIYAFSLHATKPFGIGEGGALVSHQAALLDKAQRASNFGFNDGLVTIPGGNYKLSEYHCAVGLAQLERIGAIQKQRKQVYRHYLRAMAAHKLDLTLQACSDHYLPATLAVRLPTPCAAQVQAQLAAVDIMTRRQYAPLLCDHPMRFSSQDASEFPKASSLAASVIALPFHTSLTQRQVDTVAGALAAALRAQPARQAAN